MNKRSDSIKIKLIFYRIKERKLI